MALLSQVRVNPAWTRKGTTEETLYHQRFIFREVDRMKAQVSARLSDMGSEDL
jgi:hypothetical protein